jgi:hypothetical protein
MSSVQVRPGTNKERDLVEEDLIERFWKVMWGDAGKMDSCG